MPACRRREALSWRSRSALLRSCYASVSAPRFIAVVLLVAALGLMAWLSISQIGGQTGDVLGAVEQVSEILILLVATVWL